MSDELTTGGCACGAIRYGFEGEPRYMGNCHCRDCQQATGSAYFPGVGVVADAVATMEGEPAWFERTADSGSTLSRAFCPKCGSPVFLKNSARDNFLVFYAGSLDDPSMYKPGVDIYAKSAQHWDLMDPERPKFDGMPERR